MSEHIFPGKISTEKMMKNQPHKCEVLSDSSLESTITEAIKSKSWKLFTQMKQPDSVMK